jgi:diaminopimelate decarboxylase
MVPLIRKVLKEVAYPFEERFEMLRYKYCNGRGEGLPTELWNMVSGPDGHLMVQGCDTVNMADKYGTPLYIVDKKRLQRAFLDFYEAFRDQYPRIEIAYSYKTNPLPGVIRVLHGLGASAEVISHFELWLAIKLGVPPEKIVYNGPCKTEESLDVAVSNKIKLINIDGPAEIEVINKLAKRHEHKQQVGVRVVASVGWESQFGFSIKKGLAFQAFEDLKRCENVSPCGLHIHLGTGITNLETYLQAIREVVDLAITLEEKLDVSINYFDFGGGFGVPTVQHYSGRDYRLFASNIPAYPPHPASFEGLRQYGQKIIHLFREHYLDKVGGEEPTIIFEPGRAITSSSQSLLLKVVAIKPGEGGIVNAIVDGGKNIAVPTSWEYHEVFAASKMQKPADHHYRIYGPLCHPDDLLFPVKRMPTLEPGDVLAIMDAGAYFVPNQRNFSFPRPPVVVVENGRDDLIRQRESFENIIALDTI